MENAIIGVIALLALYYLYKKTFKSGGCNCGSKDCNNSK